jgi:hypothetical protein
MWVTKDTTYRRIVRENVDDDIITKLVFFPVPTRKTENERKIVLSPYCQWQPSIWERQGTGEVWALETLVRKATKPNENITTASGPACGQSSCLMPLELDRVGPQGGHAISPGLPNQGNERLLNFRWSCCLCTGLGEFNIRVCALWNSQLKQMRFSFIYQLELIVLNYHWPTYMQQEQSTV